MTYTSGEKDMQDERTRTHERTERKKPKLEQLGKTSPHIISARILPPTTETVCAGNVTPHLSIHACELIQAPAIP